ncbi:hypothetical protein SAMN05443639_12161 [Stigmatella erecta]|uniref:Uncharacterized protein n=1 Tax=Stigmatella erecta TaxID=83460 RepID=A0A1I0L930_9BACT|nr:hypothetical protein SAMN05443639_12161 [Stigmatella erecta]
MALATTTACPHSFGREGTIDRAVHKDLMDRLRINCTEDELEAFCEAPVSELCLKNCGSPDGK